MPQQPCRDRSIRLPSFGDHQELARRWPSLAAQSMPSRVKRDVALGHHIWPEQCHQKVNIARPFADPFKLYELFLHFSIGKILKSFEIKPLLQDRHGQMPCVSGLLSAESDPLQLGIVQGQKGLGRNLAEMVHQLVKTSLRRSERNLLLKNDLKQRRESRLAVPKRRTPILPINYPQLRIRRQDLTRRRKRSRTERPILHEDQSRSSLRPSQNSSITLRELLTRCLSYGTMTSPVLPDAL